MTLFVTNANIENNLTHKSWSPQLLVTTATLNGSLSLTVDSPANHEITGSATGFSALLPDATTLVVGWTLNFYNTSAQPVNIKYSTGGLLIQLTASSYAMCKLDSNNTVAGTWIVVASDLGNIDMNNPNFVGAKDGFEDFMFDAYAGAGGNDNQYAFTAVPDTGSSGIDGAVEVVGSDYEGIHILSSLTSATARPLVHAFNGVNRMKLGTNLVSYELRVRIETLATTAEKFSVRYGLMDGVLAGLPANGVLFSYDPVYPVTPVAQIVTATPVTTSRAPTQVFTETINSVVYTYTYQTYKTLSITWTRTNNTLYRVTINGTNCNYTSDANATDAEISIGLANAINAAVGSVVTAPTGGAKPLIVTGDVLGGDFTYSGSNVTITDTTAQANATTICNSLRSSINGDAGCAVTGTGTTTLILTAKVAGTGFTYSGTANLTQVLTQANVSEVLYSGNWITTIVKNSTATSSNTGVPVVGNQWYRLKSIVNATGTQAAFYIDNLFLGEIVTPIPTVGMRYVFKLEKTLGITARTTSVDYISWRRTRG